MPKMRNKKEKKEKYLLQKYVFIKGYNLFRDTQIEKPLRSAQYDIFCFLFLKFNAQK